MRRIGLILLGFLLFLFVFWAGLMVNFPGGALSRMVQAKVNQGGAIQAEIGPARLGLFGVHFPKVALKLKDSAQASPLITFDEVDVPIGWEIFNGIPAHATIGETGILDVFLTWDSSELKLDAGGIRLENLPALAAMGKTKIKGGLEMSGTLKLARGGKPPKGPSLPLGNLRGQITDLELTGLEIIGTGLPVARLETVDFKIQSGPRVVLKEVKFKGDMQGSVSGTVSPRGGDWARAGLQLKVVSAFRQSWLQGLGTMKPLVEGFLDRGRLDGTVRGTIADPQWQKRRGAR